MISRISRTRQLRPWVPFSGSRRRRKGQGCSVAPAGTAVRNPAFDVTPAALITAIVTERGIARPVDDAAIARLRAGSAVPA